MSELHVARKSTHHFKSQTEELKTLIYNWEPIYTGLGGPGTNNNNNTITITITTTHTQPSSRTKKRERDREQLNELN
jgi:hypothetical protein